MTGDIEKRPRGAGLAILLIVAGVLILLANLGWFDWFTLSRLAGLWPVLLVAVGADMLTRGRYRVVVWGAAIVLGALLYAYDGGPRGLLGGGATESHSIAYPLDGARAADIRITTGVGTLRLRDLAGGGALVEGTIETGRGESLIDDLSRNGDTAVLRLASEQRPGMRLSGGDRRSWDLRLTREVPIALNVTTGVGQARFDLQNVRLSSLTMQAGVGSVTATLPDSGVYQASFKAGVGATTITIPSNVAARVTVKTGLGSVRVDGTFEHSGDVYQTPGYASASDRVDLRVEGGLGQITVTHR